MLKIVIHQYLEEYQLQTLFFNIGLFKFVRLIKISHGNHPLY